MTGEFLIQKEYACEKRVGRREHRRRTKIDQNRFVHGHRLYGGNDQVKKFTKETKMTFPVLIFFTFCVIVVLFQLALALGAPWGEYTMGGRFPGKLPPKMRMAALVQIPIICIFALIVLIRSGLAFGHFYETSRIVIWFVVAFFVLGSILNLATPSKRERMIWGPVNILLLLTTIIVALNS